MTEEEKDEVYNHIEDELGDAIFDSVSHFLDRYPYEEIEKLVSEAIDYGDWRAEGYTAKYFLSGEVKRVVLDG